MDFFPKNLDFFLLFTLGSNFFFMFSFRDLNFKLPIIKSMPLKSNVSVTGCKNNFFLPDGKSPAQKRLWGSEELSAKNAHAWDSLGPRGITRFPVIDIYVDNEITIPAHPKIYLNTGYWYLSTENWKFDLNEPAWGTGTHPGIDLLHLMHGPSSSSPSTPTQLRARPLHQLIRHRVTWQMWQLVMVCMREETSFLWYFYADPYIAFHSNAEPDPAPHQSDRNLRPLVCRPSRAPFWASKLPLWASAALLWAFKASEF